VVKTVAANHIEAENTMTTRVKETESIRAKPMTIEGRIEEEEAEDNKEETENSIFN
jgi:hypothetical protein